MGLREAAGCANSTEESLNTQVETQEAQSSIHFRHLIIIVTKRTRWKVQPPRCCCQDNVRRFPQQKWIFEHFMVSFSCLIKATHWARVTQLFGQLRLSLARRQWGLQTIYKRINPLSVDMKEIQISLGRGWQRHLALSQCSLPTMPQLARSHTVASASNPLPCYLQFCNDLHA